jgi:hypothetical protein
MNIFEYDGEEFDKKLDEIFANIDKEELKKELIECGLEIIQSTYNTQNEIKKIEDNSYCIIESQQLELNEPLSTINLDSNFINEEGEKEKWMEELVLAA